MAGVSTTNANNRWPDDLLAGCGPTTTPPRWRCSTRRPAGTGSSTTVWVRTRWAGVDRDVLAQSGITWLVVFEGVNDIGTAAATPAAQQRVTADLITAYQQINHPRPRQRYPGYGATITPFGGNTGYDDPFWLREAARQAVNAWIRTSDRFDAVLDFDRVAQDPQNPRQLLPAFDVGDHLHLNPAGYQALANAVPGRLFRLTPLPPDFGFSLMKLPSH